MGAPPGLNLVGVKKLSFTPRTDTTMLDRNRQRKRGINKKRAYTRRKLYLNRIMTAMIVKLKRKDDCGNRSGN